MVNTGQIKTAGKIKIQPSYLSYRSIEPSTKQVCADSIILIIEQQLRIAELEKQLNLTCF